MSYLWVHVVSLDIRCGERNCLLWMGSFSIFSAD